MIGLHGMIKVEKGLSWIHLNAKRFIIVGVRLGQLPIRLRIDKSQAATVC